MATISNFAGNSYVLSMGASESINLYSIDFATGSVTSSYFDDAGKAAISAAVYPLIQKLTAGEQLTGSPAILLSAVTISPINGAVTITSFAGGDVYTLVVSSIAAVKSRVTIAHSVQGGFIGGISQGASSGLTPNYNLQSFSSSGTWTKPAGVQNVRVALIGSGGGGGSGRSGLAGSGRFGGGSGTSGPVYIIDFRAFDLPGTVAVTIGAGGSGGAPVTNANGNQGVRGGATSFGYYLIDSNPLGYGLGGISASSTNGGFVVTGAGPTLGAQIVGGFSASAFDSVSSFVGSGMQAGTSGSGGTIDSGNVARNGLYGRTAAWAYRGIDPAGGFEAGAGGAAGSGAAGGNPSPPSVPSPLLPFAIALRSGGGGGGSGDAAATIPGGAGWSAGALDYGCSGGGGGGSTNPQPSGAGGAGGNGFVAVLSW